MDVGFFFWVIERLPEPEAAQGLKEPPNSNKDAQQRLAKAFGVIDAAHTFTVALATKLSNERRPNVMPSFQMSRPKSIPGNPRHAHRGSRQG
ncbi:hypothetical protein TcBrA4_0042150 [Trypanosoma cruzi]|nr:hypothetical protein TcBrA4_0042150 [Trypanosoma cruzi]